jgi:hypothetical protein
MKHDPFSNIDAATLAQVTGAGRVASGAGGSQINDQLTTLLTKIASDVKDLAASKSQPDQMSQMLPMIMMMKQRQQA